MVDKKMERSKLTSDINAETTNKPVKKGLRVGNTY